MTNPAELRHKSERYRQLKLTVTDQRTIEALDELAALYEAQANRLEADQKDTPAC
jgi:hypothetical protein